MSYWLECDRCHSDHYTVDNPFVEVRVPRPSNPREITCIMAGHMRCMNVGHVDYGTDGGAAPPECWKLWVEGAGKDYFLS